MGRLDDDADNQPPPRQMVGPQEGVVTRATTAAAWFTLPDLDGGRVEWGPARYQYPTPQSSDVDLADHAGGTGHDPHHHDLLDPDLPPAGTPCLVLFVGEGVDRPWIAAFSGWPA